MDLKNKDNNNNYNKNGKNIISTSIQYYNKFDVFSNITIIKNYWAIIKLSFLSFNKIFFCNTIKKIQITKFLSNNKKILINNKKIFINNKKYSYEASSYEYKKI